MALEIEAKMKVQSHGPLLDRLKERGAVAHGEWFEINTFFDTDDRRLLAADQGLRLREARNVQTGQTTVILTHKGPNLNGPLKRREETELVVAGLTDAQRLLERLGFIRTISFEKKRTSFELDSCRVELDEVPILGQFVEIEGPGDSQIMRLRETLQLQDRPMIRASYIAMLASHLQERGEHRTEVRF